MVRRQRKMRIGLALPVVVCLVSTMGCGGDSNVGYTLPPPPPPPGVKVSGTVRAPNGQLARSSWERLYSLSGSIAQALSGSFVPVGAGNVVQLIFRRADGIETIMGETRTNALGEYELPLPANTTEDTCRFLVVAGPLRAFVTSTRSPVDVDPTSEATVRLVLGQAGARLCAYATSDLVRIERVLRQIPGTVTGATASDAANDAFIQGAANPQVIEALIAPIATPTQVRSPSATPTVSFSPTLGATATPTLTFTRLPTNTPTHTQPTRTFTRTFTPTVPPPTATPSSTTAITPSFTPSFTPTLAPEPTASPTETEAPTPEASATPTETSSPTVTATPSLSATPSATSTATASLTPEVTPPHILVGDTSAAAGTIVTVPISLQQNGNSTVTLAPLELNYDPAILTFERCDKAAAVSRGKLLGAATPAAGTLRVVLAGDLVPFADGDIVLCQFRIAATATGETTVAFVSAQLADAAEREFSATGRSGIVTISGLAPPQFVIGQVEVAPGQEVTVPIGLIPNERQIVTIAPLEFRFDSGALTFRRCLRSVGVSRGKQVTAALVEDGLVRVVLAGDLAPLAEGAVIGCTFAASPSAIGSSNLVFQRAEVADGAFNDFTASGTNGSIRVIAGLPAVQIEDANALGGEVTINVLLNSVGRSLVTLAPLVLRYDDDTVLSFVECTKDEALSAGKRLQTLVPSPGELRIVLAGDLEPFPAGRIVQCRFSVVSGVTGLATVSVERASFADDTFAEYEASGADGNVVLE